MNRLEKIFLFFILLIGLGLSICVFSFFYPILLIRYVVIDVQAAFPWTYYVLAGYSGFICLCFVIFLLITLFFPNKSNFLILAKSKGILQFSKKTVESTVRYSFADLDEINASKIRIKIGRKPNKTKVYVQLSLKGTKELAPLTETVQEKIAASLQSSLGITAKSIAIKVIECDPNYTAKKESSEDIS